MKKICSWVVVFMFFVIPVLAFAQPIPGSDDDLFPSSVRTTSGGGSPQVSCRSIQNVDGLVSCVISVLKVVIYFLFTFAFIYTLYGAFRFIGAEGDSRDKWRDVIVYGIIGLFVMTSIWGLVGILDGTFGLSVGPISPPPLNR